MRLQIAKWGNSLAVRLPLECTRATGLRAGDSVDASITPEGGITLVLAGSAILGGMKMWEQQVLYVYPDKLARGRSQLCNKDVLACQTDPPA